MSTKRRTSHDIWLEGMGRYDTSTRKGRGDYVIAVGRAIDNIKAGALVDFVMPMLENPELWTSYTFANGIEAEWLPNEFDYFLAANEIDPHKVAQQFKQVDLDKWAQLVKAGTRPSGRYATNYRRNIDEVEALIRAHIVVGGPDYAKAWVEKARAGFEHHADRAVATNPKKLAAAKRLGSVHKVASANRGKVQVNYTRNGRSEAITQADALVHWLNQHPDVRRLVQRRLR